VQGEVEVLSSFQAGEAAECLERAGALEERVGTL
jgi:hypothetical protein